MATPFIRKVKKQEGREVTGQTEMPKLGTEPALGQGFSPPG